VDVGIAPGYDLPNRRAIERALPSARSYEPQDNATRRFVELELEIAPGLKPLEAFRLEEVVHVRVRLTATRAGKVPERTSDALTADVDDERRSE
jgi:hypothetical protein